MAIMGRPVMPDLRPPRTVEVRRDRSSAPGKHPVEGARRQPFCAVPALGQQWISERYKTLFSFSLPLRHPSGVLPHRP